MEGERNVVVRFGSARRFRPDSDVDVLVKFDADAPWSLWNLLEMQDELQTFFSRKVDIVEADGLRNPFRHFEIANTRKVIYAA